MSWMKALADCYLRVCTQYPGEPLMLVSDIDGTIIDMRYFVLSVLQSYDEARGTAYFTRLRPADVTVHENQVEKLLEQVAVPASERPAVVEWYLEQRWQEDTILNTHRPFPGVFPMIRWFQLQPNTSVGLISGRPEKLRNVTLQALNRLGDPYRVHFNDELLLMNPGEWDQNVEANKMNGLRHFQAQGYHVFAVIDNEPSVLKALAPAVKETGVLLLHANTIFESRRASIPRGTARGGDYRLTDLVPGEEALPPRVQLVWHGVNDEDNLRQFIASDVFWAEVDIRQDSAGEFICRHDSFDIIPALPDEEWLTFDAMVREVAKHNRGIKLDLKGGRDVLDRVLQIVADKGFTEDRLWFNGEIETTHEEGFRRIRADYPNAIVQCPIGWLTPLIVGAPAEAHKTLEMLTSWGISRFSVNWDDYRARELFDELAGWGYEVNFYRVPDLEAFLEAVVLLPSSVTSDFNFPQWHRYGRGSGKDGRHFTYAIETEGSR
ncbi:MAG: hypothetical protein V3V29_06210 [Acidimicrobiia bacterium]